MNTKKVLICIVVTVFLLAACGSNLEEINSAPTLSSSPLITKTITQIPTPSASTTPSPSSTATVSPTPSVTLRPIPSLTKRLTSTPTHVLTYSPATPDGDTDQYRLKTWTIDAADTLIVQVENYLDAIGNDPEFQVLYGYAGLNSQHEYLVSALAEAFLRFPDAPQAGDWRWKLANSQAHAYEYLESTEAPELELFASLIEEGLNSGETNLEELPGWFGQHLSYPGLTIERIDPNPGFLSTHVVQIGEESQFLIFETETGFQVHGLISSLYFFRGASSNYQTADLTGDGIPELILDYGRYYCCGYSHGFYIVDVSVNPPIWLKINDGSSPQDGLGTLGDGSIHPFPAVDGKSGFIFEGTPGDPYLNPCTIRRYSTYRWTGDAFERTDVRYEIKPPGEYDEEDVCEFALFLAEEADRLPVIIDALHEWAMEYSPGLSYRAVVYYRLGEYYARLDDVDRALEYFQKALSISERNPDSQFTWESAAAFFVQELQESNGYYRICAEVGICDLRFAFEQAVGKIPLDKAGDAIEALSDAGVRIGAYGEFDFDDDRQPEIWLTIRNPEDMNYELWILIEGPQELQALFVDEIGTANPRFTVFEHRGTLPVIHLNENTLFEIRAFTFTGEPYVRLWDMYGNSTSTIDNLNDRLDQTIEDLLDGGDLEAILAELYDIRDGFYCPGSYDCDKLYYYLGLVHEIRGTDQAAVEYYHMLWDEYPKSGFALMARLKLEKLPE